MSRDKLLCLDEEGIFLVHYNQGEGSCLFRSICQALHLPEGDHRKIRKATVRHLTKKFWREYRREGLFQYWRCQLYLDAASDPHFTGKEMEDTVKRFYIKKMMRDSEYGTVFELRAAAHLFGFHFDFLRVAGRNFVTTSCRSHNCRLDKNGPRKFFLYSEHVGGHWEWLEPYKLYVDTLPIHKELSGGFRSLCEIRRLQTPENKYAKAGRDSKLSLLTDNDDDPQTWPGDHRQSYIGCANLYLLDSEKPSADKGCRSCRIV